MLTLTNDEVKTAIEIYLREKVLQEPYLALFTVESLEPEGQEGRYQSTVPANWIVKLGDAPQKATVEP